MEEKRTSGRDEDNVRSRGQRELLKREVFIIYLKKVVFHIRAVLIFTILNGRLYLHEVCQSGDEDTGGVVDSGRRTSLVYLSRI